MVNLEHPEAAEQVRAPPRERVKPGAQDHVLREGAGIQLVLGQPAANADHRAGLSADLAGEEQIGCSCSSRHAGPVSTRARASSSTHGGVSVRRNHPRATAAIIAVLLGALSTLSSVGAPPPVRIVKTSPFRVPFTPGRPGLARRLLAGLMPIV